MKQIMKVLFLGIFATLFLVACEEDDPDTSINYQQEYVGIWNCNEKTGAQAPQFYQVNITTGSTDSRIIITDLYHSGTSVSAEINGFNVTIPSQQSDGISFRGTGSANSDFEQISISFTANTGTGDDLVEAVLTR
jgi:hypothetical protein